MPCYTLLLSYLNARDVNENKTREGLPPRVRFVVIQR